MTTSGQSPAACTHCGLPVASGRATGEEHYCCTGCFLAHRLSSGALDGRTDRLKARLLLSAFLAMGVMVFSLSLYSSAFDLEDSARASTIEAVRGVFRLAACALALPVVLLIGLPLADATWRMRRWFSSDALVVLGAAAALAVSVWNTFVAHGEVYYDTATMVLVLVGAGKWLDARARDRALDELVRIAPEREVHASRIDGSKESEVELAALRAGDRVRVRPGEVVPVDGLVLTGRSFADTSELTGEAEPRTVGPGERVFAGTRLVDGSLVVRAEAGVGARLRDAMDRLFEEAKRGRSRSVRLADRVAGALVPVVVVMSLATAAWHWSARGPEAAMLAALSVALISCPCALGIATPLAFWTAIGAAWRNGVLVRSSETLERLARVERVFLDKTGTLTSGALELVQVTPCAELTESEILTIASALEMGSEHPVACALRAAYFARNPDHEPPEVDDFRALPGVGVEGSIRGVRYSMVRSSDAHDDGAMRVELRREGERLAGLELVAHLRPEAPELVSRLRSAGLEPVVLTGDGAGPARALERALGIQVEHSLSPADKVARVRAGGARVLFVGDGLNDAAALGFASVGVSMFGGSAKSLDAAEINLLRPGLAGLIEVHDLARRALSTARLNLAWAFAYNSIGLWLAATGRLTPIFAASAMVASSVGTVLNSSRIARRASLERIPYAQVRNASAHSDPVRPLEVPG